MKHCLRPTRRAQTAETRIDATEAGHAVTLSATPIDYTVTERGKGKYLPTEGKFLPGEDERRHKFTLLECCLGGHVAALTLLTRYADAYADTDEEWEALAGSRLNTILQLRAHCTAA